MIVKVHEHKVEIIKTPVNEKEVNVTKCIFQFDEIIPNNYVKKAFFTLNGNAYEQIIVNNECDIPNEVLLKKGSIELGVVAYKVENEELIQRFNPSPDYFDSWSGSLKQATNTEPITPTDKEQIESAITDLQNTKQDTLVSGENIKTINNESLLGSGNLEVITDLSDYYTKEQTDDLLDNKVDNSALNNYYQKNETYNKNEIDSIKTTIEGEIPISTSDLENDSGFITKSVNDLENYSKTTEMNSAISNAVSTETTNRQNSDTNLQNQIDAITSASDVVDVVSTYQELQNYDTSKLTDKDVIKVMQDSTHNNALSYYRWNTTSFVYVGSEGPFYTKGETDTLLNQKANTSDIPDLTNYVKNTDYATDSKGGVIRISAPNGSQISSGGILQASTRNYSQYNSDANTLFIGKGTLENVITGKELVNQTTLNESQEEQNETINQLETKLQETQAELERYKLIENALPKVSGTGTSITLDNTANAGMTLELNPSELEQETTILPSEYKQVDYIEGNGNQYINTNVQPTNTFGIDLTLQYTEIAERTEYGYALGCSKTSPLMGVVIKQNDYDSSRVSYGTSRNVQLGTILQNTNIHNIVWRSTSFKIDDTTITLTENTFEMGLNLYLFTNNNNGTQAQTNLSVGMRIYKCKIYDGNTLVRDFIPCYRTSDSVIGLYDLVNNVFYTNSGSGTFTKGNDSVLPNPQYPQDIHTISGDNTIKVEGENLLDLKWLIPQFESYTEITNGYTFYPKGTIYSGGITLEKPIEMPISIKYKIKNGTGTNFRLRFWFDDGTAISVNSSGSGTGTNEQTIRIDNYKKTGATKITKIGGNFSQNGTFTITEFMLNKGSTPLPYTPYVSQTAQLNLGDLEYSAIGNYKDQFYKATDSDTGLISGKWYLKKNIGKITYDGTEYWELNNSFTNVFTRAKPNNAESINNMYSNYFKQLSSLSVNESGMRIGTNINLKHLDYTSVDEFKNWLSTHNTIVYYILSTSTYTLLNDTLQEQLEYIYNQMLSYQGQTNISQQNNDLPFDIVATALKDLSSL